MISDGRTPAELIRQGYSRDTVYKAAKRMAEEGTPRGAGKFDSAGEEADPAVESDPEVLELKKQLRKAQL